MQTTTGFTLKLTRSACRTAWVKGLTPERIQAVFDQPEGVFPNKRREGQFLLTGDGITLVGVPQDNDTFLAITIQVKSGAGR